MRISSRSSRACRRITALALSLVFAPALLAAQGGAAPKPAAPAGQKPAAPAAPGGARTVDIVAGDDMKYDKTTITAKPGEQLRIRLIAKGAMPKIAMAHNVVVLKLGTDAAAFVNAGVAARPTDFIAPAQKAAVIAATPLAGNGETVEVTFKVPAAPGSYPYVCTFPGHFAGGMKGNLVVKK
jgi:azurin